MSAGRNRWGTDGEGRGLHLSVGILCSKSCQRPPVGESARSVSAFTTEQNKRRPRKYALQTPDETLSSLSSEEVSLRDLRDKLRWKKTNKKTKKKKKERAEKTSCRWQSTFLTRDWTSRPSRLTWARLEAQTCLWRATLRWTSPPWEPWWVTWTWGDALNWTNEVTTVLCSGDISIQHPAVCLSVTYHCTWPVNSSMWNEEMLSCGSVIVFVLLEGSQQFNYDHIHNTKTINSFIQHHTLLLLTLLFYMTVKNPDRCLHTVWRRSADRICWFLIVSGTKKQQLLERISRLFVW